jgi:hypothetical protein
VFFGEWRPTTKDAKSLLFWHSGQMSMGKDDQYSDSAVTKRMEDALRRALNTPPKPHKELVGKRAKPKAKKTQGRAKQG